MTQPVVNLNTPCGFAFSIRPAEPADDGALAQFFDHVSKDDLRFRFLSAITKVSQKQIEAMTHIDHKQTEDFIVTPRDGGPIIANAMMAADQRLETAEVAIVVHEDFKDKALEQALLDYVAKTAKARGIRKLMSIENRENHCAIELERRMGFTARGIEGDPMLVMLETTL